MANYIREYWQEIQNGLQVSKEIKATYEHLIYKLDNPNCDGYVFNEKKGEHIIEFAESFIIMPKMRTKKTVKLLLWQKAMLQAVFGFVDEKTGLRQYQESLLLIGRKNGKTALSAVIALYLLLADKENEPEIYCIANKLQQSKILWNCAIDFIKANPQLQKLCKVRISKISTDFNRGVFVALSADKNFDGLNNAATFLDEIHDFADSYLYSVMRDSSAMRAQPLTVLTSTQGFRRGAFLDNKISEYSKIIRGYSDNNYIDNRRIGFVYKLDYQREMDDSDKWIKANPSIDVIRSREALREDVERAKTDLFVKKDVLTKFFNIPQTGQFHFLTVEECDNKNTFDITKLKPRYYIGGFDLSKVNDLTSAVCMFKVQNNNNFYVLNMNWMPADTLEEHIKKDKVPYDLFLKNGWLRLCQGNQIDYRDIIAWFEEIRINYNIFPYRLGYDPWSSASIVNDLKNMYGETALVPVRQGAKSLSLPLQKLKAELQNNNINYNNNQLLKTCLLNLKVTTDINGNLNTIKDRNANLRDDGACSLLNSMYVYLHNEQDYINLI